MKKAYAGLLGSLTAVLVALTGCGDDKSVTETVTTGATPGTTEASPPPSTTAPPATTAPSTSSDPLAGISTPSGAKQISSGSRDGVTYARYSTSQTPKEVESAYKQEFSSNGWEIVNSGGSGGGWGPYGGADYGLTAKKDDEYADVQAGGEKGSTTYFEVCVGSSARKVCDHLSDDASDTQSGGSGAGTAHPHTHSGAS